MPRRPFPVLLALFLLLAALLPAAPALAWFAPKAAAEASIPVAELPPEARQTLALIRQGGPFPYRKDGAVFQNREGLLPERPRGYYRAYTVPTPGARTRGTRRIITGGAGEFWYTADHYQSFKRIRP